jgi:diketogulonate reductase-like aldo/keto reductase
VLALLGTAHFGRECTDMVLEALKNGYRYLDTAQQYRNAGSVGEAIKRWGGKREDVYILTKCASQGVMSVLDGCSDARMLGWKHRLGGFTAGTHCGDYIC